MPMQEALQQFGRELVDDSLAVGGAMLARATPTRVGLVNAVTEELG